MHSCKAYFERNWKLDLSAAGGSFQIKAHFWRDTGFESSWQLMAVTQILDAGQTVGQVVGGTASWNLFCTGNFAYYKVKLILIAFLLL